MPTMPNVVGLTLANAEAALKSAGVLDPPSIGYFGTGTLRTLQGNVPFAAATWPIAVQWINQEQLSSNIDGNLRPTPIPGQVISQSPSQGTQVVANSTVNLSVVQPAMAIAYPGTNLTAF